MGIGRINIQNVTVFEEIGIEFSSGMNVFVGPNGVAKRT